MRDIPVFATDNGVGSLLLKEVPYKQTAYIRIHDASDIEAYLSECIGFCKAVGAEHIYTTGHSILESRPVHTTIVRMCALREHLPTTKAALQPVTKVTAQLWHEIYNKRMGSVPGAASMTTKDVADLVDKATAYFVYDDDTLLGIGIADIDEIKAVASVHPGRGIDVLLALCHTLQANIVSLDVALTNDSAVRLYKRVGFVITEERYSWYKIL